MPKEQIAAPIRLDKYIAELDFIYKHEIGDKGSIEDKKANFVSELRHLLAERRRLNTEKERAIRHHDSDLINAKTAEIGEISKQIREVRKQIKMCEELYIDSDKVMEAAYEELKKPDSDKVKIMVGGAPVTQEYADQIGADAYTPDGGSCAIKAAEILTEMKA